MIASACVCVRVSRLLAHPNTSRLITKRESESGSRGSNSSFHQRRTKDGVFPLSSSSPPPPLFISLSFLLLLLLPQPLSHAQLADFHGHIHTCLVPGETKSLTHTHHLCRHRHTAPHAEKRGKEGEEDRELTLSLFAHLWEMTDRSVT